MSIKLTKTNFKTFKKDFKELLSRTDLILQYRTWDGETIEQSMADDDFTDYELGWSTAWFNDCEVDVLCMYRIWSSKNDGGAMSICIHGMDAEEVWDKMHDNCTSVVAIFAQTKK